MQTRTFKTIWSKNRETIVENLYYEYADIVDAVLDHYIDKGVVESEHQIWRKRRPAPHTTWRQLITALVYHDDLNDTALALGWGISSFAKNPDAPYKGFQAAQHSTKLNEKLGKDSFKAWRTWFCNNILGIHYCQSCECYHEVKYFDTIKRGDKVQRETEYKHMCFETYNKDYQRAHNKDYKQRNPHKIQEASARRRARKKNCFISEDKKALDAFYANCPKGHQVDHIIPLALGGKHCLSNLQYLTAEENRFKSSLDPENWAERRKQLVEAGRLN